MLVTNLLIVHICSAVVGLLSGFMATALKKGSGLHGAAGNVFFVSMLSMSTTAVYIATFLRPVMINVIAGLLTFYLVSTGWRASRRREGGTTIVDLGALLFILAVGLGGLSVGFEAARSASGMRDRVPAPVYFAFGTVALLCAITDIRMLRRGGVVGSKRIARHLWRMSLALLIATLSLYPGQAKLFPKAVRETNLLFIPHVLLFGSMIFWRYRVSRRKRVPQEPMMTTVGHGVGSVIGATGPV
jgi:uncharacterized membrane protein